LPDAVDGRDTRMPAASVRTSAFLISVVIWPRSFQLVP
jgi:hypothetical protein